MIQECQQQRNLRRNAAGLAFCEGLHPDSAKEHCKQSPQIFIAGKFYDTYIRKTLQSRNRPSQPIFVPCTQIHT